MFLLMLLSILLIVFIGVYIYGMRNKHQIHYVFLLNVVFMFIWSFCRFIQLILKDNESVVVFLEHTSYIGVIFVPISLLFTGLIYAKTQVKLSRRYLILLVIPVISLIMVFTNGYHHNFIEKYSLVSTGFIYGKYYIVHELYSYICIAIGLYYLLYFSIKNSGFFSKQSVLISIGILLPLIVVLISTQGLIEMPVFIENISFSFAVVCFAVAIFRYQFLNVVPIALQNVVDNISDAFVVIDGEANIIDFNKTFGRQFNVSINRTQNLIALIEAIPDVNIEIANFENLVETSKNQNRTLSFEKNIVFGDYNKFFTIEITPIISMENYLGTLILLKDITEHKKNIEAIKEQQAILLEQERLASLGQLIGGIAHNLKTPIMSISGGIEALKDLTYEYRDSIGDKSVNEQDHREIAKDMLTWLDKMGPYCAYMSDVISAVKGQAVQMISTSSSIKFTVDELVKRVELLLKHELKKYHCVMNVDSKIDMSTEIKGEVNNLVQVFDNIIINAMQAYDGENGIIDLGIVRSGDCIEFTFKDNGKGIPKNVADRLFKEMVTTKGKNGTGLGLYMSYSTIKGRFGGNMSFTTKEGCGTTFFISIPCITYSNQEAG